MHRVRIINAIVQAHLDVSTAVEDRSMNSQYEPADSSLRVYMIFIASAAPPIIMLARRNA
jgi:hypothetical protein